MDLVVPNENRVTADAAFLDEWWIEEPAQPQWPPSKRLRARWRPISHPRADWWLVALSAEDPSAAEDHEGAGKQGQRCRLRGLEDHCVGNAKTRIDSRHQLLKQDERQQSVATHPGR